MIAKCEEKLVASWSKLEAAAVAAGTTCPSTGDELQIGNFVNACVQSIADEVAGGSLPPSSVLLKTGQTNCYDTSEGVITGPGSDHDGDVQKGVARSFMDKADGTVSDEVTGLMWEKQSDDGSIHDRDDTCAWNDAFASKIAALNSAVFAGYGDWRVPNEF